MLTLGGRPDWGRMFGWQRDATCASVGLEAFFPPQAAKYQARPSCHACPVWRTCRYFGLAEGYGMWGGLSPMERSVVRSETGLGRVYSRDSKDDGLDTLRTELYDAYRDADYRVGRAMVARPALAAHPAMSHVSWSPGDACGCCTAADAV